MVKQMPMNSQGPIEGTGESGHIIHLKYLKHQKLNQSYGYV